MFNSFDHDIENIALRLHDDAYVSWLQAEAASAQALRACSDVKASMRAAAYLAYQAALDREEAAARDLERLWTLARLSRKRQMAGQSVASGSRPRDSRLYPALGSVGDWSSRKAEPWPAR